MLGNVEGVSEPDSKSCGHRVGRDAGWDESVGDEAEAAFDRSANRRLVRRRG